MHTEIINAIKNNKLVFFIGSGFSRPLGFPDWKRLVQDIIEQLSVDYSSLSPLSGLLETSLFSEIEILDKLVEHKARVYNILDKEFSMVDDNSELLKRHKKIGEISSEIITTNYDKALELANPTLKKVTYNNDFYVANLPHTDGFIFKLHGCIEDPTNCILFRDDYEKLYAEDSLYKGAIEEIRKIIGDSTIIFLGFSLSDPYVNYQFQYINSIYKELKGKHFLITTDKTTNIKGIEALTIDNWEDGLDDLLATLKKIKNEQPKVLFTKNSDETRDISETSSNVDILKSVKIAILIASPLNKKFGYEINKILKPFSNMDVIIDCYYMSINSLNRLEGYQFILVFTGSIQNNVYVEDEYLLSKRLTFEHLQSEILDENFNCLFIFTDKESTFNNVNNNLPVVIKKYEEKTFNSFIFKAFKKGVVTNLKTDGAQIINEEQIKLVKLPPGKYKVTHFKTQLPSEIDRKKLINFVGRVSDLENICRKILDLNGQLLTIKASGGIGKTTIIKKVVIELSERGYFKEGIHFIDCEYITDFDTFKYKIGQCFDLDRTINLKEHMIQNILKIDKLIILDNFETLLYLKDTEKIKDLVAFLCDYATVSTTSREWIEFEFEEKYELRALTTDECVELFQKYYTNNISSLDMKILRSDIIENLLNNNPLAIKIITSNIPKVKSMELLRIELEEDFFNTTKLGYDDIFSETVDNNIERSKSLYQSINYSYSKLSSKEKLVFELLSLFPDGIHIGNFVQLFRGDEYKRDINRVTDREIKSLENKSLIQNSSSRIQLQSIVGRFASFKFNQRSVLEKQVYYNRAYEYNTFTLFILQKKIRSEKKRLEIFDYNMENLFNSLNYLDQVSLDKMELLEYVTDIASYSNTINQSKKYIKRIEKLKVFFKDIENSNMLIDVMIYRLRYYEGEFKESLSGLQKILPFENCFELINSKNRIDQLIFANAMGIYKYGNEIKILNSKMENQIHNNYYDLLFSIGTYKLLEEYSFINPNEVSFFELEILYNLDKLDIDYLNKQIGGIYKKEHIEIMQCNYIKAKMGKISKDEVRKLVIINPYSYGLKNLMFAFLESDYEKAVELYKSAIKNLEHIKYYYVEAIYHFAFYLKGHDVDEYDNWVIKGRELAVKYNYRFLIHKFDCLLSGNFIAYSEDKYKVDLDMNVLRKYLNSFEKSEIWV